MIDDYTQPDFRAIALITIDVQQDFLDGGSCEVPGTTTVLPQIATLLRAFRLRRLPIVHVVRVYRADGSNVDLCRRTLVQSGRAIVRPGTGGIQLPTLLGPHEGSLDPEALLTGALQTLGPHEVAMYKSRWGAFYRTPLEAYLRSHNVSSVAFAGCNFPNCPRTSIYEASERDFRVVLATDAVSGLYDRARTELENIGIALMTSRDLVDEVSSSGSDQAARITNR